MLVAALCYCAASVVGTRSLRADDLHNPGTAQEIYASTVSAHLFCHNKPSENSVKPFNSTTAPTCKTPFPGFCAILKLSERLFKSGYAQYAAFSAGFPLNFRKSDIIFPFHYFW